MRYLLATAIAFAMVPALHAQPKAPEDYLKLTFEAKGKLTVHVNPKTGKIGSCWLTFKEHHEIGRNQLRVDLPDKKELRDLARKLDGKTVIVTGTFHIMEYIGGDIRPPTYYLHAKSLKAAEAPKKTP